MCDSLSELRRFLQRPVQADFRHKSRGTRESPIGSVPGDMGGFFLAGRHPLLPVLPPMLTVSRPVPTVTLSEALWPLGKRPQEGRPGENASAFS